MHQQWPRFFKQNYSKTTETISIQVIGVMARTHTGLEDCSSLPGLTSDGGWSEKDKPIEKTWNVEVHISSTCLKISLMFYSGDFQIVLMSIFCPSSLTTVQ